MRINHDSYLVHIKMGFIYQYMPPASSFLTGSLPNSSLKPFSMGMVRGIAIGGAMQPVMIKGINS